VAVVAANPKAVIDRLWDRLWAGGIANPLTAIEQISYFIFLRRLNQLAEEEPNGDIGVLFAHFPELRWETLLQMSDPERLKVLEEGLITLLTEAAEGDDFRRAMKDAAFMIQKPSLARDCMAAVDELELGQHDLDFQGDVYEDLLRQLQLSGRNGQFRTPRHIIRAIVDLLDIDADKVICDPAAGTAGFLVAAHKKLKKQEESPRDDHFVAYDFDATMVRLGQMNMLLHGIQRPRMKYMDALSSSFEWPTVDVVLANPPFTGSLDRDDVHARLQLNTNRTELLFLELCRRMLRPDGQAAVIVPEGVLFGTSRAHREVRERWLDQGVQAIISLPPGVFRPYANVKTAIILGVGSGGTEQVWFCPVESDGFTLDDRREALPGGSDLDHMAEAVTKKLAGRKPRKKAAKELVNRMWSVSIEEIEKNDWSLAPSIYRPPEESDVSLQDPLALLDQLEGLEEQLRAELAGARSILRGK
jgi:type I restriction enzyme M protein